ncbi:MAG: hypothetical protein E1N59_2055 [Puniceicoccaceae bacterium 5H]|nr:MAG: hypothetical protein E1N59_2055 [Puniceicoccaceae bacterium 5H]
MTPQAAALIASLWSLHAFLAAIVTTLLALKFAPQPHFAQWIGVIWLLPFLGQVAGLGRWLTLRNVSQEAADAHCPPPAPPQ